MYFILLASMQFFRTQGALAKVSAEDLGGCGLCMFEVSVFADASVHFCCQLYASLKDVPGPFKLQGFGAGR